MTTAQRPLEVMSSGQMSCPGCRLALDMRQVISAMGNRCVVVVPSCVAVTTGSYPNYSLGVAAIHSAFEIAVPAAAGIRNALIEQDREEVAVLAFAGDGGTYDIGLQSLFGAADRNEDIIYVCMDNEGYMNTGIQVSSATPRFTGTGTTPTGNTRRKKPIMEIMAAHRIPYATTAPIAFPEDLNRKILKAKQMRGTRFFHILSPCNTGWRIRHDMAVKVDMRSLETNVFPLYEIDNGLSCNINYSSRNLPVENYLMSQGRFKHLQTDQIRTIQMETDRAWTDLQGRAAKRKEDL